MITKHLTGHCHYSSPYETDDGCGNCDGVGCNDCNKVYTVTGANNKLYHNLEEAKKMEDDLASLIPIDSKLYYSGPELYIKDGVLYACVYVCDTGYIDMPCNINSVLYEEKFKEAMIALDHYKECKCVNKDEEVNASPCSKYGCVDNSCYFEMKNRGRTSKKWYP